jgi:hypothetical protein
MTAGEDTLNVVGQTEFSLPLWACPPEGEDRHWSKAAVATLQAVTAQEFVLICSHVWAFGMYEVPSGGSEEAGTAFYNRWVGAMNTDPEAPYRVMGSKKPTVIAWS